METIYFLMTVYKLRYSEVRWIFKLLCFQFFLNNQYYFLTEVELERCHFCLNSYPQMRLLRVLFLLGVFSVWVLGALFVRAHWTSSTGGFTCSLRCGNDLLLLSFVKKNAISSFILRFTAWFCERIWWD